MYNNMNHIMSKLAGISKFLLLGVLIILSGTVRAQDEQILNCLLYTSPSPRD